MDFSRTLIESDTLVTKSNICFHPYNPTSEKSATLESTNDDSNNQKGGVTKTSYYQNLYNESNLDDKKRCRKDDGDEGDEVLTMEAIDASNQAAAEFFVGRGNTVPKMTESNQYLIDTKRYKQQFLPVIDIIKEGDLIVIQEAFGKLNFVYAKAGDIYSNRNGHFHHNDFIGKPFGCKVRSRSHSGFGFCYMLKPTAELWTRSLNHRTQIVHELDQSQIIYQLYLRPGMVVVESGTGSAAVSYSILRTIAPTGYLHTYEFNEHRCETARMEFQKHGLLNKIVSVHHRDVCSTAGFGDFLPPQSVDAIFLDLPEPWHAIPHAAAILRPNCRIATYSPCVEQTQRSVEALEKYGFHTIQTYEYRLQEHYVDEVVYEPPPTVKRSKPAAHDIQSYSATKTTSNDNNNDYVGNNDESIQSSNYNNNNGEVVGKRGSNNSVVKSEETTADMDLNDHETTESTKQKRKRKTMLVARPFSTMRGHTAFLTFATSGIVDIQNANGTNLE